MKKKPGSNSDDEIERGDSPQSVISHLEELRSRLLIVLTIFMISIITLYYFSDYFFSLLVNPLIKYNPTEKLHNLVIPGGFILKLKSSFIFAIMCTLPVILFQIWRYIKPAISIKNRLSIKLLLTISFFLFILGTCFSFMYLFPFVVKMLVNITPDKYVENTFDASKYLNFLILFCSTMGAVFNLPIIITILTKLGILSPQTLITKRKYAIVLIWIVAAVITPPDILTQSLVAIPLMFLYEISIVVSKIILIRKLKKDVK